METTDGLGAPEPVGPGRFFDGWGGGPSVPAIREIEIRLKIRYSKGGARVEELDALSGRTVRELTRGEALALARRLMDALRGEGN